MLRPASSGIRAMSVVNVNDQYSHSSVRSTLQDLVWTATMLRKTGVDDEMLNRALDVKEIVVAEVVGDLNGGSTVVEEKVRDEPDDSAARYASGRVSTTPVPQTGTEEVPEAKHSPEPSMNTTDEVEVRRRPGASRASSSPQSDAANGSSLKSLRDSSVATPLPQTLSNLVSRSNSSLSRNPSVGNWQDGEPGPPDRGKRQPQMAIANGTSHEKELIPARPEPSRPTGIRVTRSAASRSSAFLDPVFKDEARNRTACNTRVTSASSVTTIVLDQQVQLISNLRAWPTK
ncbi:hypothetical protein HK101_007214, partial [Irineochytrium annulatum]